MSFAEFTIGIFRALINTLLHFCLQRRMAVFLRGHFGMCSRKKMLAFPWFPNCLPAMQPIFCGPPNSWRRSDIQKST